MWRVGTVLCGRRGRLLPEASVLSSLFHVPSPSQHVLGIMGSCPTTPRASCRVGGTETAPVKWKVSSRCGHRCRWGLCQSGGSSAGHEKGTQVPCRSRGQQWD